MGKHSFDSLSLPHIHSSTTVSGASVEEGDLELERDPRTLANASRPPDAARGTRLRTLGAMLQLHAGAPVGVGWQPRDQPLPIRFV